GRRRRVAPAATTPRRTPGARAAGRPLLRQVLVRVSLSGRFPVRTSLLLAPCPCRRASFSARSRTVEPFQPTFPYGRAELQWSSSATTVTGPAPQHSDRAGTHHVAFSRRRPVSGAGPRCRGGGRPRSGRAGRADRLWAAAVRRRRHLARYGAAGAGAGPGRGPRRPDAGPPRRHRGAPLDVRRAAVTNRRDTTAVRRLSPRTEAGGAFVPDRHLTRRSRRPASRAR